MEAKRCSFLLEHFLTLPPAPTSSLNFGAQRAVMVLNINKPVPGAKEFYPHNKPCIGTTLSPVGARLLMHV